MDTAEIVFWILVIVSALICIDASQKFPASSYGWRTAKIWWLRLKARKHQLVAGINLTVREKRSHTLDEGGQIALWRALTKLEKMFGLIIIDLKDDEPSSHFPAGADFLVMIDLGSWDMTHNGAGYEQHLCFVTSCAHQDEKLQDGCIRIAIPRWCPAWLANWRLKQEIMIVVLEAGLRTIQARKVKVAS